MEACKEWRGRCEGKRGLVCVSARFVNGKWAMPEDGPLRGARRAVARIIFGRVSVSPDPKIECGGRFLETEWRRARNGEGGAGQKGGWLVFRCVFELKMGHAGGRPSQGHEARCRAYYL